jgi:hypothetical protein
MNLSWDGECCAMVKTCDGANTNLQIICVNQFQVYICLDISSGKLSKRFVAYAFIMYYYISYINKE